MQKDYGGEKMNCNFDEMLLYEYLDDLLEADEKILVTNHLSVCPECRRKLAEIKLLFYELEQVADVEVPDAVDAIREHIVSQAFEGMKEPVSVLSHVSNGLKSTGKAIGNSSAVNAIKPSRENTKKLWNGTKKLYTATTKKKKEPKKKLKKSLGGLI